MNARPLCRPLARPLLNRVVRDSGDGAIIFGNALPGGELTSTLAGQWYLTGAALAGETGKTTTLPGGVLPGDVVSQANGASITVAGAMWDYRDSSEGLKGLAKGTTFSRASQATMINSSGVMVSVSGPRYDYDPVTLQCLGLLCEPQATNKSTNNNTNPTGNTNITINSGSDPAAVLTVVDDLAALTLAGLAGICNTGKVYRLDNSLGTALASASPTGTTGNTNTHTGSAYVRGGSGSVGGGASSLRTAFPASASYVRRFGTFTPTASTTLMGIQASPGQIVYFILNQLEDGGLSSVIPIASSSAVRQADAVTVNDLSGFDWTKGTFIAETGAVIGADSGVTDRHALLAGTGSNSIQVRLVRGANGFPAMAVGNGSVLNLLTPIASAPTSKEFLAVSYSTGAGCYGSRRIGQAAAVVTANIGNFSGTVPASLNIGQNLGGYIRTLIWFPFNYSAASLQTILAAQDKPTITGIAVPGETLTSTHPNPWRKNGVIVAGQSKTSFPIPATYSPGDVIDQVGSNAVTLLGAFWDFSSGSEVRNGTATPLVASRASQATMTDLAGALVYAPHNRVLQSGDIGSASWLKSSGVTVLVDQTAAPDGTMTADLVIESVNNSVQGINQTGTTVSGERTVVSVYAKAKERTLMRMNVLGASPAVFNLAAGTIASSGSFSAQMTNAGNGWWRCVITHDLVLTNTTIIAIGPTTSNTGAGYVGDGTSGVYLWGAQINTSHLTPYVATTTAAIYGMRFESGGLLLEGQCTNKCTNNNANPVDTSGLMLTGDAAATLTVVDDLTAVSTAKLQNICFTGKAYKLDNSAGATVAIITIPGVAANLNAHTVSCCMRGGAGFLRMNTAGSGLLAIPANADYVRRYLPVTPVNSSQTITIHANAGQVIYFILNQLEEEGLSSVIVTNGASAVRQADSVNITDMAWFNRLEGSLIIDAGIYPGSTTPAARSILSIGGSGASRIRIDLAGSLSTPRPVGYVGDGTTFSQGNVFGAPAGVSERVGVTYSTSSTALMGRNGVTAPIAAIYSGFAWTNMNLSQPATNGYIKSLKYFPKLFTKTQIINITTP